MITKANLTENKSEIIAELNNYCSSSEMLIELMQELVSRLYIGFETWQDAVENLVQYNDLRKKKANPNSLREMAGRYNENNNIDAEKAAKKYMID